jgi:hypothetical protein
VTIVAAVMVLGLEVGVYCWWARRRRHKVEPPISWREMDRINRR